MSRFLRPDLEACRGRLWLRRWFRSLSRSLAACCCLQTCCRSTSPAVTPAPPPAPPPPPPPPAAVAATPTALLVLRQGWDTPRATSHMLARRYYYCVKSRPPSKCTAKNDHLSSPRYVLWVVLLRATPPWTHGSSTTARWARAESERGQVWSGRVENNRAALERRFIYPEEAFTCRGSDGASLCVLSVLLAGCTQSASSSSTACFPRCTYRSRGRRERPNHVRCGHESGP